MLASHALALAGIPLPRVLKRIRRIRDGRYQMLRGHFHSVGEEQSENIEETHQRLHAVTIQPGVAAVGLPLIELPIGGCRVTALVRQGRRIVDPAPELGIDAGDTLVLAGTVDQVNGAEASLLKR
jgi:monovalent cation:H+ antiporter-2, CPA2 family